MKTQHACAIYKLKIQSTYRSCCTAKPMCLPGNAARWQSRTDTALLVDQTNSW